MRVFLRGIFALLVVLSAHPAIAQLTDNQALNAHYTQFIQAFSKLDTKLIDSLYSENACYLPEGQNKAIIIGKQNILDLHRQFFKKIRHKKARIDVDFRVIDRQLGATKATDVGYFLVRFHPPKETGEPVSEFAGKFVTVLEKQPDEKWYLTVDSSHRADPSLFFSAKHQDKLYYGNKFVPLVDYAVNETTR